MRSDRHKNHQTKHIGLMNIVLTIIIVILAVYIGRDYLDVLPIDQVGQWFKQ